MRYPKCLKTLAIVTAAAMVSTSFVGCKKNDAEEETVVEAVDETAKEEKVEDLNVHNIMCC